MTTDYHPLPSMENQLCRGRVVVLRPGLQLSTGFSGPRVSWVVQAKVSPHLRFAWAHPTCLQSEMAATHAGLGDSQAKPSSESRLDAASAGPGAH